MNTKSPCSNISEAEYAEMVEHRAIEIYRTVPGSKPLLNTNASPGAKRLDTSTAKGSANLKKCPGVALAAQTDAMLLLGKLAQKAPGSGM